MHICIVTPSYPTSTTIDFIFVDQLCRAMVDKGIKVSVIAPQSLTKCLLKADSIMPAYSIITTSNSNTFELYRPYYITSGNIRLLRKNNERSYRNAVNRAFKKLKQKPDVCYGHFWSSVYAILSIAKNNRIPLFASSGEESVTIQNHISRDQLNELSVYTRGVISVSTKNKQECIKAGLVGDEKCMVIPNAVDTTLFYVKDKIQLRKQYGFDENDFIVAFVGQFNVRKGTVRLSKALTLLNDDSIKALFMGSGNEQPDYKQILVSGTISHNKLPDYLNCADVFVLPTQNEGCCNAIIEAMACGLPVISSNLAFNWDILNMDNSILIDPNDVFAIAKSIMYLKENIVIRKQISASALASVQKFNIEERTERILTFIKSLI